MGLLAAEDDLHGVRVETRGQNGLHLVEQSRWQIDVVGAPRLNVVEMGVR